MGVEVNEVKDRLYGIVHSMRDFYSVADNFEECEAEIVRLKFILSGMKLKIDDLINRTKE